MKDRRKRTGGNSWVWLHQTSNSYAAALQANLAFKVRRTGIDADRGRRVIRVHEKSVAQHSAKRGEGRGRTIPHSGQTLFPVGRYRPQAAASAFQCRRRQQVSRGNRGLGNHHGNGQFAAPRRRLRSATSLQDWLNFFVPSPLVWQTATTKIICSR
jgi:hypothetical protein